VTVLPPRSRHMNKAADECFPSPSGFLCISKVSEVAFGVVLSSGSSTTAPGNGDQRVALRVSHW
jgi:hypothetical protein